MKCTFISVLMNLIYGEGPEHNSLPLTSTFKLVIHLCYRAEETVFLFIPGEQWCSYSVTYTVAAKRVETQP